MIGTLLTFLAMGAVSVVVAWIVLSIVGAVLGLTLGVASFLLFKVAPVMLVGWVLLKLLDKVRHRGGALSAADRQWLEGD
ncbi:MAG: hypothetical protein HKN73_13105 [Gemmatimonadetes bacterium]|nr:hypothetical protein [Gemmatimonadota bacterium]